MKQVYNFTIPHCVNITCSVVASSKEEAVYKAKEGQYLVQEEQHALDYDYDRSRYTEDEFLGKCFSVSLYGETQTSPDSLITSKIELDTSLYSRLVQKAEYFNMSVEQLINRQLTQLNPKNLIDAFIDLNEKSGVKQGYYLIDAGSQVWKPTVVVKNHVVEFMMDSFSIEVDLDKVQYNSDGSFIAFDADMVQEDISVTIEKMISAEAIL